MNPDSIVVACGCYVQARKDDIPDGIDIVIGNNKKQNIVEILENYEKEKNPDAQAGTPAKQEKAALCRFFPFFRGSAPDPARGSAPGPRRGVTTPRTRDWPWQGARPSGRLHLAPNNHARSVFRAAKPARKSPARGWPVLERGENVGEKRPAVA